MNLQFIFKVKFWQLWKQYVLNRFSNGREDYPIGSTPLRDIDDIEGRLLNLGYQPNYFSYGDQGQITSMRRMYVGADNIWWQWHVRVHEDGEIRGHVELSYEEDAIRHRNGDIVLEIPQKGRDTIIAALNP